jgi:prepilin-type N-terminal cleavage/methylation domain-containing protein
MSLNRVGEQVCQAPDSVEVNILGTRHTVANGIRRAGQIARDNGQKGFTLIELMIVVSILAVMAALAAPGFNDFIAKNRVKGAAEEIFGLILQAKSETTTRDTDMFVNVVNGSSWCVGYDTTPDCVCSGTVTCQVPVGGVDITQAIQSADYRNITLSSGSDITFRNPRITANPNSTITVTSGDWALNIVVSLRGRVLLCNPNGNVMTGYEAC